MNANAEAFRDCLYALEARQWMIMKVLDHLVQPGAEVVRATLGAVDWKHYEEDYRAFLETQKPEEKPEATPEDGAVIFGG